MYLFAIYGLPNWLASIILFCVASYLLMYLINIKVSFLDKIAAFGFVFLLYSFSLLNILRYTSINNNILWTLLLISVVIWIICTIFGLLVVFYKKTNNPNQ